MNSGAGRLCLEGRKPADERGSVRSGGGEIRPLDRIAEEYGEVLEQILLGTPPGPTEAEAKEMRTRLRSLRRELEDLVTDYESAREMATWSLPWLDGAARSVIAKGKEASREVRDFENGRESDGGETQDVDGVLGILEQSPGEEDDEPDDGISLEDWASLSDEERATLERPDSWHEFAEVDYLQGAIWVHLLDEAQALWETVPRPGTVGDCAGSVWGRLIRSLRGEEARHLKGKDPAESLELRFRECRASAWRVVVQEVRKRMLLNQKPGRSDFDLSQAEFDVQRALEDDSFFLLPGRFRDLGGTPEMRLGQLERLRSEKGSLGVAYLPDKIRPRLKNRQVHEHTPTVIKPTKECIAGLLWTSEHLPLCLMRPAAAADAVREIILSGVGNRDVADPMTEGLFRARFRVMTNDRAFRYFEVIRSIKSVRAEIVSQFSILEHRRGPVPEGAAGGHCQGLDPAEEGEPSRGAELPWLRDRLKEIEKLQEMTADALSELSKEDGPESPLELPLNLPEPPLEHGRQLIEWIEEQYGQIDSIRESLSKSNLKLRGQRSRLKGEIRQQEAQETTPAEPDPGRLAALKIAGRYTNTGVEAMRFRMVRLGLGMIVPVPPR